MSLSTKADLHRPCCVPADFQELMRNAPDITNCVEACNLEGRGERMDNLLAQLEMCEKALQDYLETKRIAFPRFYFVAPMGEQRSCKHCSTAWYHCPGWGIQTLAGSCVA